MAMLRIMSRRGDDRITWYRARVEVGDPEALAAVKEAERIFEQERARGATAFRVEQGRPTEVVKSFDPTAEQTVLVPRVIGG